MLIAKEFRDSKEYTVKLSFLDLLEKGMSLFTTGIDEYPVLAVFEQYVEEVKEERWLEEDVGDGVTRHTLDPKFQTAYPLRVGHRK